MNKVSIRRLLLVEDNPGDARLIREMLGGNGPKMIDFAHVQTMQEAEHHLSLHPVDIILLDLGLPDAQGLEAVRRAQAIAPHVPLVVLTGLDDESLAEKVLQEGAQDHLIKGQIDGRGLLRALHHAAERKTMEDALFEEKERAQVTLDSIGDAVVCTDLGGDITFLNAVAETMSGWSLQASLGRKLGEVFPVLDATTREAVRNPMYTQVEKNRFVNLPSNCILIRADGFEIPVEDTVAPLHDRAGNATGAVFVFRDVTLARAIALQLAHAAQHDFLTGLPNRMLLNDRIAQSIAIAARQKKQVAILFLDLDGFKHINDSIGHDVGDKLLQSVAKRLVNCVRGSDTVSRHGGDEFVILLSQMERPEDAAVAAAKIQLAVAQAHPIDQQDLHITTSIGASVYPEDGLDSEMLIKNADVAMYQVKEGGKGGYRFFKPAMNALASERQSIEEALRSALSRDEFSLYYQPRIDLRSGTICGAEAQIRWTAAVPGSVRPDQIMSVAEESGLMLPISAWALRTACRQACEWLDAGYPAITMAIKVCSTQFKDERFLASLFAVLQGTGMAWNSLELELTERTLMQFPESSESVIAALRLRGVRFTVDDFGTGYSNLRNLNKFPIDALKIDESFVRQISSAQDDATVLIAAMNMARNLKLRVIAAGVDTLTELAFLHANQCDEIQGILFSPPLPATQFAVLHAANLTKTFFPLPLPMAGTRLFEVHA